MEKKILNYFKKRLKENGSGEIQSKCFLRHLDENFIEISKKELLNFWKEAQKDLLEDYLKKTQQEFLIKYQKIIEAAQALYKGHNVQEISRSDSGAINLTKTANCLNLHWQF
jgi:hypothetical protein